MKFVRLCTKRQRAARGDVFIFQLHSMPGIYFFGKVISVDSKIGFRDMSVLMVYIYRATSSSKEAIPCLSKEELLVAPIGTNNVPFTRGYFEILRSDALGREDVLAQHCFFNPATKQYFDEMGQQLEAAVEPIGIDGLSGLESIAHKVITSSSL
jgi:hypothetical protein